MDFLWYLENIDVHRRSVSLCPDYLALMEDLHDDRSLTQHHLESVKLKSTD
jgi:hypothetical protein